MWRPYCTSKKITPFHNSKGKNHIPGPILHSLLAQIVMGVFPKYILEASGPEIAVTHSRKLSYTVLKVLFPPIIKFYLLMLD